MKHIKLFENWAADVNPSHSSRYYSAADEKKLRDFAEEVSNEIQEEYVDQFDRKSTGLNAEDYSPEEMFTYIYDWGEGNGMTADEVIADFKWNELTQELGLENPFGR
jgi:hypothetical protein